MDRNAPEVAKPRSRWWVRALLVVSLALNLAFIGLMVGAAMRFGGPERHRPPPSVGAALYRALPDEDRKAMREAMRAARAADRGEARRADLQGIAKALRAEPFDAEALAALTGEQFDRHSGWIDATQQAWLARIGAMTPEERAAYAERLGKAMDPAPPPKPGWFARWRD